MSEYVDTKLINCNRLASVESRTGNDSNPAVFTNPLNETIRLNVGDKVSVERAFINEVGAGNPSTIEFKGVSKGSNSVATYTDIQYGDYYRLKSNTYDARYRLGYYRSITTSEKSDDTVDLRDNLAPLVIGYFITSNEYPNYIQQPRRFINNRDIRGATQRDDPDAYTKRDSVDQGFPLGTFTINTNCICFADWVKREGLTDEILYKQKVDNKRYTLFIKDKIAYSGDEFTSNNYFEQFPSKYHNGIFQEATYYRMREKINIEVNKGFNTPSAVASQITNQLTETKNETIFEVLDNNNFTRPLTKTIETSTYKPINAQNIYNVNQVTYTAYTNQTLPATADNVSQNSIDYIATFGYIGVKRPEIFEAGRKMHELLNVEANSPTIHDIGGNKIAEPLDKEEGFTTLFDIDMTAAQTGNSDQSFVINVLYTEDNLKIIRDFFDTQALYPELWDDIRQTVYYAQTNLDTENLIPPSLFSTRFFHMNKYTTDTTVAIHNETFGDDAFTQRASPNNIQMTSAAVFFHYDETTRDKFTPANSFSSIVNDGFSYGFATPHIMTNYNSDGDNIGEIALIKIHNYFHGGVPRDLFTDTNTDPTKVNIDAGRRLGYDFHSTAYSTAIITPYSGYANTDIGVSAALNDGSGESDTVFEYPTQINHIRSTGDQSLTTDMNPYMTMSYIGANNPAINYNTTTNRFELSRFHTGNNTGNKATADNPSTAVNSKSLTPSAALTEREIKPAVSNQDAGQTVYKINPRPPQFGFSPTFKPYTRFNQAYRQQPYPETAKDFVHDFNDGPNTINYNGFNINIEPYQIFDSHGGIYIEDWGFDEDNWEDSLWDILGFDYSAVNAAPTSKNVLTKRVDNENSNLLYRPTTNAEVVQTDTKNYITNQFGAVMYYTSLPYPTCVPNYTAYHSGGDDQFFFNAGAVFNPSNAQPLELWNQVDILTQSTTITATDIQKSVLRPYYTIRSNILEGATAIGGNPTGANLPIISIVDKYSAASDYFLGNPSDIQFTVTKPTMIADITTSIHDSDGEYANVDKTSAIIYKITKIKRTPAGLIEEILEGEKNKKK